MGGVFYSGNFFFTLMSLFETVASAALYHQRDDIDSDGEAGSYFVTNILGIKPQQAVQISFRMDFWCTIVFPLTFSSFCLWFLTPEWSTGGKIAGLVGVMMGTCFVVMMCFALLRLRSSNRHKSFGQIFWRFQNFKSQT